MRRVFVSLCCLMSAPLIEAVEARWQVSTEVGWLDNVTNAERADEVLSALRWQTAFVGGYERVLRGGNTASLEVGVSADFFPRFEGLDQVGPALELGWEKKLGLGAYRPTLQAGVGAEWMIGQERDRSGQGAQARLAIRQRVTSALVLTVGYEGRRFDARGRAFDRTAREWSAQSDWSINEAWRIRIELRRREGDVVSYSRPPRPDLVALGKPITFVDTFEQAQPWIAYYFDARTTSSLVEVARGSGRNTFAVRHEYHDTQHGNSGYLNQVTAIRFGRRF